MNYDFDLVVIGAGSGGVRASRVAASLGAKVAVVEERYLGGTCVNVGCVPKKLFVYASEYAHAATEAVGFGWQTQGRVFDWNVLRDNKDAEIARLNGIYGQLLDSAGVERIVGHGELAGPHHVRVGERVISTRYILLAVGGWPERPRFPGAEHVITSNDVFHLPSLPRRVLIQGGGYIAVEFAGIFHGLGCETELVYRGPLFLRGFDGEVRAFVAEELRKAGITLTFNTDITAIEKETEGSLRVQLNTGETCHVDAVLSAIGRRPLLQGLGLEHTRVGLDDRGYIAVDSHFRTAEPTVFALGDVIGRLALTPVALAEGTALARALFADTPIQLDYTRIPTAVFCQPNIGTLGLTESQAEAAGRAFRVYTSDFRPLKHTLSGAPQRTFMKLLVEDATDRVIGVHMVGPEAGEILQGFAVALNAGATKADFDRTVGIHPTAAEEFVTLRTPVRHWPSAQG